MPLVETINIALAILSIAVGAIAFISPDFALSALKLTTTDGAADGKSELRAASGGAFIALGAAALLLGSSAPIAWVMMGVHYAGAAAGRLLSFALDRSGSAKMWLFFAFELVFAAWLIGANWR